MSESLLGKCKSVAHSFRCYVPHVKTEECANWIAETTVSEWVSVEERLPEMDGVAYEVVRIDWIRYISVEIAQGQAMWYTFKKFGAGISHWKKLPALPMEGRQNGIQASND